MEHKRNQAPQAERALALAERRVASLEAQAALAKDAVKESSLSLEKRPRRPAGILRPRRNDGTPL